MGGDLAEAGLAVDGGGGGGLLHHHRLDVGEDGAVDHPVDVALEPGDAVRGDAAQVGQHQVIGADKSLFRADAEGLKDLLHELQQPGIINDDGHGDLRFYPSISRSTAGRMPPWR